MLTNWQHLQYYCCHITIYMYIQKPRCNWMLVIGEKSMSSLVVIRSVNNCMYCAVISPSCCNVFAVSHLVPVKHGPNPYRSKPMVRCVERISMNVFTCCEIAYIVTLRCAVTGFVFNLLHTHAFAGTSSAWNYNLIHDSSSDKRSCQAITQHFITWKNNCHKIIRY